MLKINKTHILDAPSAVFPVYAQNPKSEFGAFGAQISLNCALACLNLRGSAARKKKLYNTHIHTHMQSSTVATFADTAFQIILCSPQMYPYSNTLEVIHFRRSILER